jgi:hypothetical protein
MENPPAPVPAGDESSDDIEGAGATPLPPFKPAGDGIKDVHMQADQRIGVLTAIGKPFRKKRAEALSLSDLIRSFALALYKVALEKSKLGDVVALSDIDDFSFASAHIRFVAGENETFRIDGAGSPSAEAAQQIALLMQAKDDDLLTLAQETGPEGAKAYKQFMKAVSQAEDAEVTWEARDQEPVTVTSVEASRAFLVLDREGEPEDQELEAIPGHLSMADASAHRFKLLLPKAGEFDRPTPLKGKRVIEGHYDDPVGESVKSQGLWDRDVIATIRIEREKADTVATPRDPTFHLVSVEAAVERVDEAEAQIEIQPPTLLDQGEQAG